MPSVLLIEDDGVIARSIGAHLRHGGLDVEWAQDGERGLRKLRFERPDVAVVDLMLPGLDGWTVTERRTPACACLSRRGTSASCSAAS